MRRLASTLALSAMLLMCSLGMALVAIGEAAPTSEAASAPTADAAARLVAVANPVPESSHYLMLDADGRAAYDALYQGIAGQLQEFEITVPTTDAIADALHAIVSDHPELFWVTGACTYRQLLGGSVSISLDLNIDIADIPRTQAAIDAATDAYLASLPVNATTYDKVRTAYEWVIRETDYGYASEQHQNIQSVFVDHVSVCAGYAKAFQYLLAQVDVPCVYVRGTIDGGTTEHAWNLVWIDGTPTLVDVTWGDPTYATTTGETTTNNMTYDYLCLTSAEMERCGHVADAGEPSVTCSSDAYDHYRQTGLLFDAFDRGLTDAAFDAAFDAGDTRASFKFTSDEAYAEARAALADTSLLDGTFVRRFVERHGNVDAVRYRSATNDALRIITIFW